MDLETFINLILVFSFLVISILVMGVKAKQERQRQKKEQGKETSDTTFWDEIAEEGMILEEPDELEAEAESEPKLILVSSETVAEELTPKKATESRIPEKPAMQAPALREPVPPSTLHPYGRRPSLRQAVVWAEIIGKPVSLRTGQSDSII